MLPTDHARAHQSDWNEVISSKNAEDGIFLCNLMVLSVDDRAGKHFQPLLPEKMI